MRGRASARTDVSISLQLSPGGVTIAETIEYATGKVQASVGPDDSSFVVNALFVIQYRSH